MKKTLVATVGGSHQPIVQSINQHKPNYVHFVCSDDVAQSKGSYVQVEGLELVNKSKNDLSSPDLPNIVVITKLPADRYQVHRIKKFDNLNDCYLKCAEIIASIHADQPDSRVIADYTGGTKSMTAGLAAAALDDDDCDIALVTGVRADRIAVADKTEFVKPVHVWEARARQRHQVARRLIARFDYAGAAEIFEDSSRRFASEETLPQISRCISFCRAFDAWDRFDHATAYQLLQPYRSDFNDHKRFLAMIVEDRGHGWELVEDLLLNAKRRAAQGRWDDAVGRLYRALELTAHAWLAKKYGIEGGNVSLSSVPESLRDAWSKRADASNCVKLGARDSWEFIAEMPGDCLSQKINPVRRNILHALDVRNKSLFAHGKRPIAKDDYEHVEPLICDLLSKSIESAILDLGLKRIATADQLPCEF